ncbi:DNA polymerase III subunit delta [Philodulcilactobacillus myokoensis]|uniref:DNA polymerase III subunit delta n=1 Tax=Philodulcilactobacillus myokoensis TaxID=2929573 RepID=A0A9W6ET39_9LACO|nr:DNA polymerase III subunit delta [Philodulcilactobacillus myokoensis]GLB46988.1 DNA polymerase III subunit delta [Philodulcilactobacillus myokoensis]
MNVNQLLRSLPKNDVKPVYLILGRQEYLSDQIKNAFIKLVPKEERTMNYASYDMEDTPLSAALNDAMSAPFFGKRRVVLINQPYFLTNKRVSNNIDHDIDGLIQYLKHPEPSSVVVFMAPYPKLDGRKKVTKRLKNVAEMVDINKFSESQVKNYVKSYINQHNYKCDANSLNLLIQRTGGKLSMIMNELPKLFVYCRDKVITSNAINNLVTKSLDQNIFDLVNYVLKKRVKLAVDLYHNLILEQKEPLQINAILVSQFRLLLQVMILASHGHSQGSLASILKVHPFRIKLALRTIQTYQFKELKQAYLGLIDNEIKLKSSQASPELLFEMFMLSFISK